MTAFIVSVILLSKISFKIIMKSIKPMLFLIIFTALLNMIFTPSDTYIFTWWFIKISYKSIVNSIFIIIRIVLLVIGTSLLTYTTSPILLTDGLESLMSPLKKVKVPVHEISMMMTIALRFIPTLIDETDKIMNAQKARGADIDTGGIIKKAKSLIPILIPLFISAFRRATELATAMECRCYRGGEGRTRLKQYSLKTRDYISLGIMTALLAGIILLNVFSGSIYAFFNIPVLV